MPKFVVLASCKYEPYAVLAMPNRLDAELYESDHEAAYAHAWEYFKPAIESADIVIVYAPEGIGEHTMRDMNYAYSLRKRIIILGPRGTPSTMDARTEPSKEGSVSS